MTTLLAISLVALCMGASLTLADQGWAASLCGAGADIPNSYGDTEGRGRDWVFKASEQGPLSGRSSYMDGLMVAPDGTVYTMAYDLTNGGSDGLIAIDRNGSVKWLSDAGAGGPGTSGSNMVAAPDGTVYCIVNIASQPGSGSVGGGRNPSPDYHLRAIDPGDGSLIWEYLSPGQGIGPETQPVVSPNGQLLFKDALPGAIPETQFYFSEEVPGIDHMTSLYPNGSLAWRTPIAGLEPSIAVGADSSIYAISGLGYLYALYPNGTIQWNITVGSGWSCLTLDGEGSIYIMGERALDKYDPDGVHEWSYASNDTALFSEPLFDGQSNVYLRYGNQSLASANNGETAGIMSLSRDGSVRWMMEIESGPLAVNADGTIFIASADHFTALKSNGSTLWQIEVLRSPHPLDLMPFVGERSVAVGADGTVFFLGSLWVHDESWAYIMAVTGSPSFSDPGRIQQLLFPAAVLASMSALMVALYQVRRRNRGEDRD